ncbi:VENN motif pre-toxin domain-containing protein [Pectobacterium peruviense]|uniref:VENN motif pre-toxin domain-containing protein n=1 Tax=Pectobacterium peruviense TaxID=2066479 RepID=UPI00294FF158|nr:VENN motif pre-toxin domain-containing protein [Pectobacterium peruviense]
MASNSTASAASGAQSGCNAVENNALGADAGTALGFWLGKSDECGVACKAEIAKGVISWYQQVWQALPVVQ